MSLLGERLRQERENRGLALLQIELDTRIRANLIQALEEGNLNNLPPEPFLRGLLRTYANYLRIDPKELLDLYVTDISPAIPPGTRPLIIQRPIAGPRPPTTRPEIEERTPSRQFSIQPPPSKPAPLESSAEPADLGSSSSAPHLSLPTEKPHVARSSSFAESMKALGRRLPLAPPSSKPPRPVLRPANSEPPPSIPPEMLSPREVVVAASPSTFTQEPIQAPPASIPEVPETRSIASDANAEPAIVEASVASPVVREPEATPVAVTAEPEAEKAVEAETELAEHEPVASEEPTDEIVSEAAPESPFAKTKEATEDAKPDIAEQGPIPPPYIGDGKEPIGHEIPVWVHVEEKTEKEPVADTAKEEEAAARRKKMKTMRFALIGIGAIVIIGIAALIYVLVGDILPNVSGIAAVQPTATPTLSRTSLPSPTLIGAISTEIPILDAAAEPFTPVALIPTQAPTKPATPIRTGTVEGALNLEIQATQPITAQIGVDGDMAFNGTVAPGTSVSYSARESLYIRIQNLPGGTITFNGRKQLALNFGERSVFERQWNTSATGKITAVNPVPPSAPKSSTPIPVVNPLPSPTAVRTPSPIPATPSPSPATPTATPTDTATPTSSPTPSSTSTRSGPTPTLTPFY